MCSEIVASVPIPSLSINAINSGSDNSSGAYTHNQNQFLTTVVLSSTQQSTTGTCSPTVNGGRKLSLCFSYL